MMSRLFPALPFLLLVVGIIAPADVIAETKIITAAASYTMGDGETPLIAEARVLQQAKQTALEQAGTYVESYTKVLNYDLTAQEIQTIAGGIIAVEVLEKTRRLVGDGIRFDVKIKATVTTDKMEELAQRIKGKNVAEEYEALQMEYAKLNEEIETWKQLVAKAPAGPERNAALEQIREREMAFSEVQHKETTLFKRLVSGKSLVSKALSQLGEKLAKKRDEKAIVDALFEKILKQGHIITIDEPDLKIPRQDSLHLEDHDRTVISVPVTLQSTDAIKAVMKEAARDLGGEISQAYLLLPDDDYLDGEPSDRPQALIIQMGQDPEIIRHFQRRMENLIFILELVLDTGGTLRCYVENHRYNSIFPIFPTRYYNRTAPFITGSVAISPYDQDRSDNRTLGHIGTFDATPTFIVKTAVSLDRAKQIATIRGKMDEKTSDKYSSVYTTLKTIRERTSEMPEMTKCLAPSTSLTKRGVDEYMIDEYVTRVKNAIHHNWNWQGDTSLELRVVLSFRVYPNGRATQVAIAKTSGNQIFDRAAMKAATDLKRLPRFHTGIQREFLDVEMDFSKVRAP